LKITTFQLNKETVKLGDLLQKFPKDRELNDLEKRQPPVRAQHNVPQSFPVLHPSEKCYGDSWLTASFTQLAVSMGGRFGCSACEPQSEDASYRDRDI